MSGTEDRVKLQELAYEKELIDLEPRRELVWLQALGDLIAHAEQLQNEIKNAILQDTVAPDATVWNPEEFNEIKRSIEAQSGLVES